MFHILRYTMAGYVYINAEIIHNYHICMLHETVSLSALLWSDNSIANNVKEKNSHAERVCWVRE